MARGKPYNRENAMAGYPEESIQEAWDTLRGGCTRGCSPRLDRRQDEANRRRRVQAAVHPPKKEQHMVPQQQETSRKTYQRGQDEASRP